MAKGWKAIALRTSLYDKIVKKARQQRRTPTNYLELLISDCLEEKET